MAHKPRKKLIEVALPLDAINKAAAREKSIRHGHPSTLHLWWARRPLAAARAVIFSQMVDDPSEYLDTLVADPSRATAAEAEAERRFRGLPRDETEGMSVEEVQERKAELAEEALIDGERDRLFSLIEDLVQWKSTTKERVLERARAEIRRSWARHCLGNQAASRLTDSEIRGRLDGGDIEPLPAFHDPFAGGGSLPLEAQRLGLEAYASDLNPVAVLINKAMIEIPPKLASMAPANPVSRARNLGTKTWQGAQGPAEDIRYYGQWMRDEACRRIGHLYPPVRVTQGMAEGRRDLRPYVGEEVAVIAWIWARTVRSPNPAFSHVDVPLISTYVLSDRRGREAWLDPVVDGDHYRFRIRMGRPPSEAKRGTKLGHGANFACVLSGTPLPPGHIKSEAQSGRMGQKLLAMLCEGRNGTRVWLEATEEQESAGVNPSAGSVPDLPIAQNSRHMVTLSYGLESFTELFTNRQLAALEAFSDLVGDLRAKVDQDAVEGGTGGVDHGPSQNPGATWAEFIGICLAFALDKCTDYWNTVCTWMPRETVGHLFSRHAIPMTWDFPEANPLGDFHCAWHEAVEWVAKAVALLPATTKGLAVQADAATQQLSTGKVVSTDPPYYDNVPYADISDFFYLWLRRSLRPHHPDLLATMAVPKAQELVADPVRHGGRAEAESFFMTGMTRALEAVSHQCEAHFPVTVYYAFKQGETGEDGGTASTGWEAFLEAVMEAGLVIDGTWPVRTERGARTRGLGSNALASSIVLVCRPRTLDSGMTTRRDLQAHLRRELPRALRDLQHGNIAPVDLAQSAIGPGMAIFSRYSRVVEADGSPMRVRTALALINEALDEILAEQEGELDADTRWAIAWFGEYGTGEGPFGRADDLSRAKNTSVEGLVQAGIVYAKGGKVNLLRRDEMAPDWDPASDKRLSVWEAAQHLIRVLEDDGESSAAELLAKLVGVADQARDLAYRLYVLCERKGWADDARSYNGLVIAWPELVRLAAQAESAKPASRQQQFEF